MADKIVCTINIATLTRYADQKKMQDIQDMQGIQHNIICKTGGYSKI